MDNANPYVFLASVQAPPRKNVVPTTDAAELEVSKTNKEKLLSSKSYPAECTSRSDRDGTPGASSEFSNMPAAEICALLGADNVIESISSSGGHMSAEHKTTNLLDKFPKPLNRVLEFSRAEFCSRWFYQTEEGDFQTVPRVTSKWMMSWLFGNKIFPPSFAPVVLPSDTTSISAEGRRRSSKLLQKIRELCDDEFALSGDFFRGFRCSWSHSSLYPCGSVLYVVACSNSVGDLSKESIKVQCVFTEGCTHHRDDISRGISRPDLFTLANNKTPNELCQGHVSGANPISLVTGNRTFGYLSTATARQAQSRFRNGEFNGGAGIVQGLTLTAEELASADLNEDIHRKMKFYASAQDIFVGNAGELRSVSVYNDLSLRILSAEFRANPHCSALIDCTGKLVRDVWISCASDMAKRSREGRGKKPKEVSSDGKYVKFDVLNLHFVVPLATGTFVGCEAILIERASQTFIDLLSRLKRRLSEYGQNEEPQRYFVTDMSVPFAIAILHVFNRMHIPEYMSCLLYSAKISSDSIVKRLIPTKLVWCGVHGDRAMQNFAKDKLKQRGKALVDQFTCFLRNIRLALVSCKSYRELCLVVGFIDMFLCQERLPALGYDQVSIIDIKITSDELIISGEKLIWEYLGGVPAYESAEQLFTVMVEACKKKGYNSQRLEEAYSSDFNEDIQDKIKQSQLEENDINLNESEGESTKDVPEDFITSSTGIIKERYHSVSNTLTFLGRKHKRQTDHNGPFDVYVSFREMSKCSKRARYRVYIPCLSLLPQSLAGFSVWRDKLEERGHIWNEFYVDGKARQYMRKQWFPNLALFCPVVIGNVPLSHNISVELSFKSKKYHTELGVLARQRPGGMDIVEYTKRAGIHMRLEARIVVALLRQKGRSDRDPRKRAALQRKDIQSTNKKKPKTSFQDVTKNCNPTQANNILVSGVFKAKTEADSDSAILTDAEDYPTTAENTEPASLAAKESDFEDPTTLQSQQQVSSEQEIWERKGKSRDQEEYRSFLEVMRNSKERYFGDWPLRRIAQFLTRTYLEKRNMKIDGPALSRIFNQGKLPGAAKCSFLRQVCSEELPRRTLVDENNDRDFHLLPGAEKLVKQCLQDAEQSELADKELVRVGDGKFYGSDTACPYLFFAIFFWEKAVERINGFDFCNREFMQAQILWFRL